MESILHKLASKQLSTCVSIIIMFTYTILLNRDFACTCESQEWSCVLYLLLPFCIVFFLTLWTNGKFLKVCRYTCASCSNNGYSNKCCCFLIFSSSMVVEALSVGLLWVVFVLIDGDWYVCCENDHSEAQSVLACKDAKNITKEEKVTISKLKNTSRIIGASLLLGIIFVGILLKCFGCCRKSKRCNRKFVYNKLILEEEEKVLEEELRKSAHDQLRNEVRIKIEAGNWEECFDVAEELIDKSTRPDVWEQNEEQQTERRAAENQVTEEQQTERRAAENQVTEEQQTERRAAENQVTEEQQTERRAAENQVTEEQQTERRAAENQVTGGRQKERRAAENQVTGGRQKERRAAENQVTRGRQKERRAAENQVTRGRQKERQAAKKKRKIERQAAENQEQEMPLLPRREEQIDRQEGEHRA